LQKTTITKEPYNILISEILKKIETNLFTVAFGCFSKMVSKWRKGSRRDLGNLPLPFKTVDAIPDNSRVEIALNVLNKNK
jgi:hypothetical protein